MAMSGNSSGRDKRIQERREERKEAFFLLFGQMFQKDDMESLMQDARDARDAEIGKYTKILTDGVEEKLEELDARIEENLRGWKKNRVSRIALTIMRMAVYEMLYVDSVPVSVSINEAVELAKEYATPSDASFVNGVLGSVAKKLETSGEV